MREIKSRWEDNKLFYWSKSFVLGLLWPVGRVLQLPEGWLRQPEVTVGTGPVATPERS